MAGRQAHADRFAAAPFARAEPPALGRRSAGAAEAAERRAAGPDPGARRGRPGQTEPAMPVRA